MAVIFKLKQPSALYWKWQNDKNSARLQEKQLQ